MVHLCECVYACVCVCENQLEECLSVANGKWTWFIVFVILNNTLEGIWKPSIRTVFLAGSPVVLFHLRTCKIIKNINNNKKKKTFIIAAVPTCRLFSFQHTHTARQADRKTPTQHFTQNLFTMRTLYIHMLNSEWIWCYMVKCLIM